MSTLRDRAIRLAHDNPGPVRDALLPILRKSATDMENTPGSFSLREFINEYPRAEGILRGVNQHLNGRLNRTVIHALDSVTNEWVVTFDGPNLGYSPISLKAMANINHVTNYMFEGKKIHVTLGDMAAD